MDKNLKIGIVGLGLIGGSIFKALCALKCNVSAVTRSEKTIEKAKEYSKNVSDNLENLKICDIVFVCTPMNKTLSILDDLENILPKTAIVSDVCSLKGFLTKKERPYIFIPSHPMAGTEFSGFDNSFERLFQGAKWILTPNKTTDKSEIDKIVNVIKIFGAEPVFCTPKEHDEAVALISHMPMLVSQAIFKTAIDNKLALKLASSGFRDMTRLSMSNIEMAEDMINMNSKNIQNSLLKLYSAIGILINSDYKNQIESIKSERQKMYNKNGKNIL